MGRSLNKAATAIAVVSLIAFGSCAVFGQVSTAAISGVVRDASGAVVPGVTVTVKHVESGLTRTVVTNETGSYTVQLLPVGAYEITTDLPGFKQEVRRGVNLVVGQEAVVNLTRRCGARDGNRRSSDREYDPRLHGRISK